MPTFLTLSILSQPANHTTTLLLLLPSHCSACRYFFAWKVTALILTSGSSCSWPPPPTAHALMHPAMSHLYHPNWRCECLQRLREDKHGNKDAFFLELREMLRNWRSGGKSMRINVGLWDLSVSILRLWWDIRDAFLQIHENCGPGMRCKSRSLH